MIYCRFQMDGGALWGVLEDHAVHEVTPNIFVDFQKTGRSWPMHEVQLLAPSAPSKIVAVGLNYKDHITEFGRTEIPKQPVLFLKAPSALAGPDDNIRIPPEAGQVDYEAELAVVISRMGRRIPESKAMDHV